MSIKIFNDFLGGIKENDFNPGKMCVIMNLKGEERVKKKIILFTTLLVIGGSAGIYTAFCS